MRIEEFSFSVEFEGLESEAKVISLVKPEDTFASIEACGMKYNKGLWSCRNRNVAKQCPIMVSVSARPRLAFCGAIGAPTSGTKV